MSYGYQAPPPPAPAPRVRPATVTISGGLIFLIVLAAAVYLAASIAIYSSLADAFDEVFAGTEAAGAGGLVAASAPVTGAVYLLVALALAVLAIFNNQGRNGARIASWVVGGVGLCCGGLNLLGTALAGVQTASMPDDQELPPPEQIDEIFASHLPGWYEPLTITTNVVGVLVLIVALILLALPASNEFFRKAPPPPEQAPGYPPPGYPPVG